MWREHGLEIMAVLAFALLVEGSSGLFLDGFGWIGLILGFTTFLLWCFQRLGTIFRPRPQGKNRPSWLVRYLTVPALAVLAVALVATGVASSMRYTLSRAALQAAADQAMASPINAPGDRWSDMLVAASSGADMGIGLYSFAAVDRVSADTVVFLVDASGVMSDAGGFAFKATGQPDVPFAVAIEPLGGGWWVWYEEWD